MEPQTYAQPIAQPQFVMMPIAQRNGLGVFGFFVALIGLFIPTGIVALLGLVLCLAAIGRAPRGFATCGVILGLFGTIAWLGIMIVALVAGMVAVVGVGLAGAAGFLLIQPEVVEVTSDMVNVAIAAEEYQQENDELPTDIGALSLAVAATIDPWGEPYLFVLSDDEPGFDVVSGGPDGELQTDDDVHLGGLDDYWEAALEGFGAKLEEFGEKLERLSQENGQSWASYCEPHTERHTERETEPHDEPHHGGPGHEYEREARRAIEAGASR